MKTRNYASPDAGGAGRLACSVRKSTIMTVLISASLAPLAGAADSLATWDRSSADWSDPARWSHSNPAAAGHFPNNGNGGLTYDALFDLGILTLDVPVTLERFEQLGITAGGPTLTGPGSLTVNESMLWNRGTHSGTGVTTIGPQATLNMNNSNAIYLERQLVNNGTATWQSTGVVRFRNGTFTNNGFIAAEANDQFQDFFGTNVFENTGTLTRQMAAGTGRIRVPFNNSGTVIVSSGTLEMDAGGTSTGTFLATGPGTLRFAGSLTTHDLAGGSTVSGDGTFHVANTTTVHVNGSYSIENTSLSGGVMIFQTPGVDVMRTRTLTLAPGATSDWSGRLDLTDNALVIDYDGASPLDNVISQIRSGHSNGSWDSHGITSSLANATTHGLGYAEASALPTIPPVFGTVDDTAVLVFRARYGDANLDGFVNLADFNRLAANFGSTNATWAQGDFNYDRIVNLADFNRLAANFGLAAAGLEVTPQDWANLAAAIPEPALLRIGIVGFTALLRRRRRR